MVKLNKPEKPTRRCWTFWRNNIQTRM